MTDMAETTILHITYKRPMCNSLHALPSRQIMWDELWQLSIWFWNGRTKTRAIL